MSKARDLANLLSDGSALADGTVAATEVTGLSTVATSGDFTDLSNQPAAFDPSTLASVAVSGSFNDLSNQPSPFDPSTLATVATSGAYSALSGKPSLGTASAQATGAFATAAQGTKADDALPKAGGAVTGDVTFGDNDKAVFGAGSDLQIYHAGSNSYIADEGAGLLTLKTNGNAISLQKGDTETMALFAVDGAATLYHNNAAKIATNSGGITVTGSTAHTAGDITNTVSGTYNLNGANGTAGNATYATYSFKDDVNTGMYRGGADTLSFATGGTERMTISSTGVISGDGSGLTGVGGAWTLISETPITSSVHYIDVTFPAGYVEYIVEFPRLYGASTSQFTPIIRVLDTSGNPVTTYHGYRTAQSSIANTQSNTYHVMGAGFYSGSANTAAMRLHFFNQPRSSNTRTMANTYNNAGPAGEMENGRFVMKDHFAVGGMRLYSQWGTSSGPITSASHDYKIWGLK